MLEAFTIGRVLSYPSYSSSARFDLVTPLGGQGSLRLGLTPEASWVSSASAARLLGITPSAGLTLNADDWDFMVAPNEMNYRGPGVKLDASCRLLGYVRGRLSSVTRRLRLSGSAPWTLRLATTRLELGPDANLYWLRSDNMRFASSTVGAHVLFAGGSRVVDVLVTPEYGAANGPGWEVLARAYRAAYNREDTTWDYPDYFDLEVQARAQVRAARFYLVEPGLTIRTSKLLDEPFWAPRLTPRMALTRLWTARSDCLLIAQLGASLPVGFQKYLSGIYNAEVILDAHVGLCAATRPTSP